MRGRRTRIGLWPTSMRCWRDNRFPDFVAELAAPRRARGIPVVLDVDQARSTTDALFALAAHVISSARRRCAAPPARTIPARGLRALSALCSRFPRRHRWAERHVLAGRTASCATCRPSRSRPSIRSAPAISSTAPSRWRWPSDRDIADAFRFASATAAIKCTRFGGGASARRGAPKSMSFYGGRARNTYFCGRTRRAAGRASAGEIFRRYRAAARWAHEMTARRPATRPIITTAR